MDRKLKQELSEYFEAPKPEKKRAFVRQFGLQKINMPYMVFMQARYISKWVWLLSALVCGLTVYVAANAEIKYVGAIFACIPFLVMVSVTESTRSYRYGMEELELSARFSLKSIVMARMVMLGLGNLAVLACTLLLLGDMGQVNAVYVIAPYFLTAGGGLCIVRKMRGNEGAFLCFGLAALVSAMQIYLPWQFESLFEPQNTWIWAVVCGLGFVATIREGYRTIRMAEVCEV